MLNEVMMASDRARAREWWCAAPAFWWGSNSRRGSSGAEARRQPACGEVRRIKRGERLSWRDGSWHRHQFRLEAVDVRAKLVPGHSSIGRPFNGQHTTGRADCPLVNCLWRAPYGSRSCARAAYLFDCALKGARHFCFCAHDAYQALLELFVKRNCCRSRKPRLVISRL